MPRIKISIDFFLNQAAKYK